MLTKFARYFNLTNLSRISVRTLPCSSSNLNSKADYTTNVQKNVLITGGLGQLGLDFANFLRGRYGRDNILLTDIKQPTEEALKSGRFEHLDVLDARRFEALVVENRIDLVIHFSAILSALGESNVQKAIDINIHSVHSVLEICRKHKVQLYCPSSIAAFGSTAPRNPTPDFTVQRPRTIYGVSKVHMELMGEYYAEKYGLDFRSLRYPGIISSDSMPGGGTTDYAVHIFYEIAARNKYSCFLREDSTLPMMFLPDCVRGTVKFLETPREKLKQYTYNLTAVSFNPKQLVDAMRPHFPQMEVTYEPDPVKQTIADTWPQVFDDSNARRDWGWNHKFGLEDMVQVMVDKVKSMK
ncbi:L-threonine 3-dehydrogenase, mitochondrial [Oopsacas minuta]|uniref:L-threonine 3-dehydrogenase, mitochondrial n=1 Tax=Oopsacas minuta TaxID=111878 RepID=A0AAV7KGT6_9METZ|nr:L-threonine 3-dehydrogenase, mitochondrial [Oopsacas minuta]